MTRGTLRFWIGTWSLGGLFIGVIISLADRAAPEVFGGVLLSIGANIFGLAGIGALVWTVWTFHRWYHRNVLARFRRRPV